MAQTTQKIREFKAGSNKNDVCSSKGDVLDTIKRVLNDYPQANKIMISPALMRNMRYFGTVSEARALINEPGSRHAKDRKILWIDKGKFPGEVDEDKQYFKIMRGKTIIAQSLNIDAKRK